MKLNHLDILEQCFRNNFFGYNKEDVDSFLHLVADDFKEIAEELEILNKKLLQRNQTIEKLNNEVIQKSNEAKIATVVNPEVIKEKAKRIINVAREHANHQKKKAEQELSNLKKEIVKIKQEKENLIKATKSTTQK